MQPVNSEELLGVADRIYVMYNGKIVKELSKEEATSEKLFYYTAGGVKAMSAEYVTEPVAETKEKNKRFRLFL